MIFNCKSANLFLHGYLMWHIFCRIRILGHSPRHRSAYPEGKHIPNAILRYNALKVEPLPWPGD